jgi:pimeloyl-ACP methyl ester carboxylesterase
MSREPTRARYPDEEGYVERDGVRLFYEVYGEGEPAIVFCGLHGARGRGWKAQIPYLARRFRVVTYDARGSGDSDRPAGPDAYRCQELAADLLALSDKTSPAPAIVVAQSVSARPAIWALAREPERFAGAVFVAPYVPLTPWPPVETMWRTFEEPRAWRRLLTVARSGPRSAVLMVRSRSARRFNRRVRWLDGAKRFNASFILRDQRGFVEWNMRTFDYPEPHSTRPIEDGTEWNLEVDPQTQVDAWLGIDVRDEFFQDRDRVRELCARIACPVLVVHGQLDIAVPEEWSRALAEVSGGRLLTIERAGHFPPGRKPVPVNLALREFAESLRAPAPVEERGIHA